MSDERIRQLERQWKNTGDLSDEYALLSERFRREEISRRNLALCAFLGHKPSMKILETPFHEIWTPSIEMWGPEFSFRASIYYIREGLLCIQEWLPSWSSFAPRMVGSYLKAIIAWMNCPCPNCAISVRSWEAFDIELVRTASKHNAPDSLIPGILLVLREMVESSRFDPIGIISARDLITLGARQVAITDTDQAQFASSQKVRHQLINYTLGYEASIPFLNSSGQS